MKYYTLRFLDAMTLLETLTSKKKINRISKANARSLCKQMGATSVEIYESDKFGTIIADWTVRIVNVK
jgi:hypothetical protein